MIKYAWIAMCVGLLGLTVYAPYWPYVVGYGMFLWLACPSYNFLSSYCGKITVGFVLLRVAQAAFLIVLAYLVGRLFNKKI